MKSLASLGSLKGINFKHSLAWDVFLHDLLVFCIKLLIYFINFCNEASLNIGNVYGISYKFQRCPSFTIILELFSQILYSYILMPEVSSTVRVHLFSSLLWHVSLFTTITSKVSFEFIFVGTAAELISHVGDGKPLQHSVEVMEIALDQFGSPNDRRLALIDKNRDLFLAGVRLYGSQRKFVKLATMVRLLSSMYCTSTTLS